MWTRVWFLAIKKLYTRLILTSPNMINGQKSPKIAEWYMSCNGFMALGAFYAHTHRIYIILNSSWSSCLVTYCIVLTGADCGSLTNPANGLVNHTAGTTLGQTATYSCNTGYYLVGNSIRTCQVTEVWSGSAPTCQGRMDIHMHFCGFSQHSFIYYFIYVFLSTCGVTCLNVVNMHLCLCWFCSLHENTPGPFQICFLRACPKQSS